MLVSCNTSVFLNRVTENIVFACGDNENVLASDTIKLKKEEEIFLRMH